MEQLHFIAGTPRSGSTLLSAILRQNPHIHASISSPLANLFDGLMKGLGAHSEYYPQITDEFRYRILYQFLENFYQNAREIVFDTNRYWCSKMPVLQALLPQSRVICCVRDLVWIIDSFERLFRKNPLVVSKVFKPDEGKTVYQRVDALMSPTGTVYYSAPSSTGQAQCAVANPGITCGTLYGNSGPGIVLGPGQFNFDISVLKTTRIRESQTIQFRAEFFNAFNDPQFTNPNSGQGSIYSLPNFAAGNFGQITSTSVNPRIVQLALKYIF